MVVLLHILLLSCHGRLFLMFYPTWVEERCGGGRDLHSDGSLEGMAVPPDLQRLHIFELLALPDAGI